MNDKKNDKVKFDIIPKTNEQQISGTSGCIRFIGSYRFLSSSPDELVGTIENDVFEIFKKNFQIKRIS